MPQKSEILLKLKELKSTYESEGVILLGLFGSYAKDTQTKFSDIDIVYDLDYDKFSQKYVGGFSKVLRLDDIKKELQSIFHKKVDLVSNLNRNILEDMIYV